MITEQSGYRNLHSCETALNYVIADWKCEIDIRNLILAIFVDFERAFETINRLVLLAWFADYLKDRQKKNEIWC